MIAENGKKTFDLTCVGRVDVRVMIRVRSRGRLGV
jgi:hypothetical protein